MSRASTADVVSFETTRAEARVIGEIVARAKVAAIAARIEFDGMSLHMDLSACHANGCPLKLVELLEADDANFGHDVWGIRRFIDRNTGKLGGHFVPRFAQPQRS